jgi:hypothetical protein
MGWAGNVTISGCAVARICEVSRASLFNAGGVTAGSRWPARRLITVLGRFAGVGAIPVEGIPLSALPNVDFSALVASMIGASGALGIVGVIFPTLIVFRAIDFPLPSTCCTRRYHTLRASASIFSKRISRSSWAMLVFPYKTSSVSSAPPAPQ